MLGLFPWGAAVVNSCLRRAFFGFLVAMLLAGCPGRLPVPPVVSAPSVEDPPAALREALARLERGEARTAASLFEALASVEPATEDACGYFLGLSLARTGETGKAREAWLAVVDRHPESVWRPRALLELGRLAVVEGRPDEGEKFLRMALEGEASRDTVLEARVELAKVFVLRGDIAGALGELREVRLRGVGTSAARSAKELQRRILGLPEAPRWGREDWLREAEVLLEERDFVAAEAAARNADPAEADADALWALARALRGQKKRAAAATVYGRFAALHPGDARVPRALFELASLLWNADEDVAAEAAFRAFLRRFPAHELAADAWYALGRIAESKGRFGEARRFYERTLASRPSARLREEAGWRIGWVLYRAGRWVEASRAFGQAARRGSSGALYWQARALERSGKRGDAVRLFARLVRESPHDYYAWLGELRLGLGSAPRTGTPPGPLPDLEPPPGLPDYHLRRYRIWRRWNFREFAWEELAALRRAARTRSEILYVLVESLASDDYPGAWALVRRLDGGLGSLPAELGLRLRYPLAFWDVVRREAERHDLDPFLVLALIRQESFFDPRAHSPADARGLMQLLPTVAAEEGAAAGLGSEVTAKLDDPEINVALGVRHLRRQLDRWKGDVVKALASYNGGWPAVERWVARFGDLELDEFVESITYRETRDYVKRVLTHYRAYRAYYGGLSPRAPLRLVEAAVPRA
ncbi:MAG: hypothetical protein KatS3mg076_2882 [Candidatus Binatia bacterium]|nr:MAG: hypothetical protein KatS3mg076_2882 [Candidatus Binatia bacterium]